MTRHVTHARRETGTGEPMWIVTGYAHSEAEAMALEAAMRSVAPAEAFTPVAQHATPAEPAPHPLAVRQFDHADGTDGEDAPCIGSICPAD